MEEALYLVKYRVRDEVVCDVAQRWLLGCGKEFWLLLGGQRAYPFEWKPLAPMLGEMMVRGPTRDRRSVH